MTQQYKHLQIEKEIFHNERRTRKPPPPFKRNDLQAHAHKLKDSLNQATIQARQQIASEPGKFVLKLNYLGSLDFDHLIKHGIEFISQEGQETCVVFSDEKGLSIFEEHLSKLGLNDTDITYKQILEAIDGIHNWTEDDRKSWAIKKSGLPSSDQFYLDIELWPVHSTNHPERQQLCVKFEQWLKNNSIKMVDRLNRDSLLMYRVELNKVQAKLLFQHRDIRYIDLAPQTGITFQQCNIDISNIPKNLPSPPLDSARICILDSGINTNHPLLKTAIQESASFVDDGSVHDDAGHGTAVAGVALYGNIEECLSANFWQPQLWIFNGKLLSFNPETGDAFFNEKSIETSIVNAVKYFVEEFRCRIFNLSIGNLNSPYDGNHIRGIAYVLDLLARQYDILFVVSAGNFFGCNEPPIPIKSWREEYPEYLIHESSIIIDPAPAMNVLTVGSLAQHNAHEKEKRYPTEINSLSPAIENQPSPFTRHGPSIKGALKPDLVAVGGNLASPLREEGKQWKKEFRGLGVLTLNHQFSGSSLLKEISGTSFAAPYITHLAGRVLNEYPQASANLLRALLVNHAEIPQICFETFSEEFSKQYKNNSPSKNRELIRDIVGYGKVNEDILYRSTENAVVLIAEDKIENNICQFFELPLPVDFLRSKRAKRELRVSLAYSPPVRTTRLEYLATKITFRLVKGKSLEEVAQHFDREMQKEKDTLNDASTSNRTISAQQRDKGTVQSSYWELKQLNPSEKWFVVVIRQDREWGKPLCLEEEPYALVVTVMDKDNLEAQLYTQIQLRIRELERVQARING
ncbi:S8 family peptidase [Legionella pneumophila serogroup 1]|nr:S8 family serine peptidase [Legionella pneumophila subsp. pneumophila]